jgi:hypothetical protein
MSVVVGLKTSIAKAEPPLALVANEHSTPMSRGQHSILG